MAILCGLHVEPEIITLMMHMYNIQIQVHVHVLIIIATKNCYICCSITLEG